jgi:hypothetical protein
MSGQIKSYDPNQVIIIYGGVPISGLADGTFIQVTNADAWSKKVGADGEVGRSKSNDYTSEVTLTLMQTSSSNNYLSGIVAIDKASNAGALPLQILDLSGTSLHFWPQAWIRKTADAGYSKEIGDRAWVFDTGQPAQNVVGGDVA